MQTRYVDTGSAGGDGTTTALSGANAAYASITDVVTEMGASLADDWTIYLKDSTGSTPDVVSATVDFSAITTNGHLIDIEPASGQEATDTWDDTIYIFQGPSLTGGILHIGGHKLGRVQIEKTGTGTGRGVYFGDGSGNGLIDGAFGLHRSGGSNLAILFATAASAQAIRNCIGVTNSTNATARVFETPSVTALDNNTAYGGGYGFNVSSILARNNVSFAAVTGGYLNTAAAGSDYNASDYTDAPGSNSQQSIGDPFTNAAGLDFSSNGSVLTAGLDLSADATDPFTTDINGVTRINWTKGASEYISGGSTYSLALGSVATSLGASDLGLVSVKRLAVESVTTSLAASDLGFTLTVLANSVGASLGVSDLGLRFNRRVPLESVASTLAASDLGMRRAYGLALGAPAVALAASDLGLTYRAGVTLLLGSVAIASDASDLGLRMGRKIALGVPAMLLGTSDLGLLYGRLIGLEAASTSLGASGLSLRYSAIPTSFPLDAVGVSVGVSSLALLLARQLTLAGADVSIAIGDLGLSLDTGLESVPTTPLDGPLRNVAEKLIAKFGKKIVLRFVTTGSYDTSTRTYSRSTADQTTRALLEAPGLDTRRAKGESGPGGSKTQEWKLMIAAKGLTREPTPADLVVIGDKEFEISGVDPTYSGGLPALYELRVKR